jgi:hypothetical protein
MSEHDFSALFAQYPTVIVQMPQTFTSHEFILELARKHQDLYVEALHSYRGHLRSGRPAPFLIVHGILAQQLNAYTYLIEQIRKEAPSRDIFGEAVTCAEWRQLALGSVG